MNAESMPLKQHDHQQSAADPAAAAAGGGSAPFRTTKTTTRTTLVTRALVVVCGVAAVVAGVTYLSTGSYPRSPVASGATGGVLRKESTTTITLAAFTKRYPELLDISPEDQAVQYQAYLLYSNGMTVDELDAYYHTHNNGQQEGCGAGATNVFRCCKDKRGSSGCRTKFPFAEIGSRKCLDRTTPDQKYECGFAGWRKWQNCCRTFPDNRVGSKFWAFSDCHCPNNYDCGGRTNSST